MRDGETARGSLRVLVAHGDAATRTAIKEILADDDRFAVITLVNSGDRAVAAANGADVVVLGRALHGLGSVGAISHIRRSAHPPVVAALTTAHDRWDRRSAVAEGVDEMVEWPIDGPVLAERLALAAARRRS